MEPESECGENGLSVLSSREEEPPRLVVVGPSVIEASEGDDVLLRFQLDPKATPPTSVTWGRVDEKAVSERFHSVESGDWVELRGERVTAEDGGAYWARAASPWGEAKAHLALSVLPQPPGVPHFLRRLSDLAVKVGTRTRFLVEIRSPSEIRVIWLKDGTRIEEGERFQLLNEGNFFCIDVAPVSLDDTGRWSCLAKNVAGQATCSCNLNVLVPKAYKKPEFVEELRALLTEQGTVSLECKVVGVPTPTLKWFKDDQEIKAGDVFALTADPRDATSLGTYTCEAVNCMGKAVSTSNVHLVGGPKDGDANLKPAHSILPPGPVPVFAKELRNEKVKIGGSLTLECRVKVPPWPKTINWYNKEGEVKEGGRYHIMEDGLGSYSTAINPLEASDEGLWKCVATSNTGVKAYSTCQVQMAYPKNYRKPKFLESLKAILTEEGLVSFECKVVGNPTPNLSWYKDGQELKPGDVYQLTGTNSLGTYCCIAKNCMGEASSTAELTIEDIQSQLTEQERMQLFSGCRPPRFVQGLKSTEAKINENLKFTVQVSVSPEPSVLWFCEDEQIEESAKYRMEKEQLGIYHLNIAKLEFSDQAEWKCVATNDYGQSVTSCFLKLNIPKHYKKPKFLENLRAVLSEEGAVNLECKVIGVPQPVLKWYKDGKELKPGDIHRIISGQDGTCCLGTYTCEANNCMGTASSSASLLGFEERGQSKAGDGKAPGEDTSAWPGTPPLSTIHEERTSQMHDTERSLTIDERAEEISFSFDGKEVSVSLYETPDLTEEEALQIVEMYADQISEHVSEHNVVDLPPMRFVKESSTSGHLMMEAVVIDVSQDYFSAAEDDLRTDADLEEFSIFEDPAGATPEDEGFALDKINTEFLERSLAPPKYRVAVPRHAGETSGEAPEEVQGGETEKAEEKEKTVEEDEISAYTDALASLNEATQKESFKSALSGSKKEQPQKEDKSKKETAPVPAEKALPTEAKVKRTEVGLRRKSSDSEKEDDSLKEFEKRKHLKSMQKVEESKKKERKRTDSEMEDDSLYEFESRKTALSEQNQNTETDKSPEAKIPLTVEQFSTPETAPPTPETKMTVDTQRKSEKEPAVKEGKKKKKGIKIPVGEMKEVEVQKVGDKSETDISKKSVAPEVDVIERLKSSEEEEKSGEFDTAEAYDRSDLSVLESLTQSLQEIQKGLASVEAQVLTESPEELHSAKSSISVIESLAFPINEIQRGLEAVEQQVTEECAIGQFSAQKMGVAILNSLVQPMTEFNRNLALVEQQTALEGTRESLFERTNQSILESVVQPLQDLNRELALIQQSAVATEAVEPSVLATATPALTELITELTSEDVRSETRGQLENREKPGYAQSVQELQQGLAKIVEDQAMLSQTGLPVTKASEERKKRLLKSLSVELRELEENATEDLAECHEKLVDCGKILRSKAVEEPDPEINNILKTVGGLVNPLKKLTTTTSKCVSVIVDDYEASGLGAGVPSSALIESLTKPLEALKISLQLFEEVISYANAKEIRGIGIPMIYKLRGPMEELETTVKLVENLSAHTAMEFLASPLAKLTEAVSSIDLAQVNRGFVENLEEGVQIVKGLDDSLEIMTNCITAIDDVTPMLDVPIDFAKLTPLTRPMEEFQKHLKSIERVVAEKARDAGAPTADLYRMAQELNKPLELMRMELSILQHRIEADHFGEISSGKPASELSEAMYGLTGSLEKAQAAIVVFHESIKRKPPEEPVQLRYVLYSLKELTKPINDLCSSIMKAEETIVPHGASDAFSGLKTVTKTLHELHDSSRAIKSYSVDGERQPQLGLAQAISADLSRPLDLVREGLVDIIEHIHEKDKRELNLNLLKTMSEPFNVLQKALIAVDDKLSLQNVPATEAYELKQAVQELQRSILVIQDQVSFEYGDEPSSIESNIVTLESLVRPLQTLQAQFSRIQKTIRYENKLLKRRDFAKTIENLTESAGALKVSVNSMSDKPEMQKALAENSKFSDSILTLQNTISSFEKDLTRVQSEAINEETYELETMKNIVMSGLEKCNREMEKILQETAGIFEITCLDHNRALVALQQLIGATLKPALENVAQTFSKKDWNEETSADDTLASLRGLTAAIDDLDSNLKTSEEISVAITKGKAIARRTRPARWTSGTSWPTPY